MTRPADSGLSWGVLARFTEYVRSSGGLIDADGGAIVDSTGMASWPLLDAEEFADGVGVLRFAGTVRFSAHFGALDLVLADPVLEVDGAAGSLVVATVGNPALPVARFEWREVAAMGPRRAWVGEGVGLAGEAVHLFGGVYPPGTPLDPLIAVLEGVRNS